MTTTEQPPSATEQAALTRACNELPPWKAGVGVLICAVLAVVIYRDGGYLAACWISACGGMFLQDWAYRFRDKYDPQRRIGNE